MFPFMPGQRNYRILDKDLARIGYAEGAGRIAARPLRRIGIISGAVLGFILIISAVAGISFHIPVILGISVAIYLGLNIGANDVANSAGPVIGAGAIPAGIGLAAIATAQLIGALLAGGTVTQTITNDVFIPNIELDTPDLAAIMAAALIGTALWITLANWVRAPVSTTHSTIGALTGAGIAGLGPTVINWSTMAELTISWVFAPIASGLFAAILLGLLRWRVHFAADRPAAAQIWLPGLCSITATVFALYITGIILSDPISFQTVLICLGLGGVVWGIIRWQLARKIASDKSNKQLALKRLLSGPLVISALLFGFAHGANDVANIAGPLSILLTTTHGPVLLPHMIILAGLSIAMGSFIFGKRLVHMVGMSITRLNSVRAFCATLTAALTVLISSAFGFPVSTTHCIVGGIFGVGLYREFEDHYRRKSRKSLPAEEIHRRYLVRRSHLWTTLAAWAVTVPGAGVASAIAHTVIVLIS